LDFEVPFATNTGETAKNIACWLTKEATPTFSVVGLFSSSVYRSVLGQIFDQELSDDASLLEYLTSHLYTKGEKARFGKHVVKHIELVRNYIGNRVIRAIDSLLSRQGTRACNAIRKN
jgi:hypothetical protein